MKDLISIVITSFIDTNLRKEIFSSSLNSLLATTKNVPCEIIIVDNSGSLDISYNLLEMCEDGKIQHYIRNNGNMHFGYARDQGISLAKGNYIVISDNDIFYRDGWIEALLNPLKELTYRKIYTTPIEYPTGGLKERYDCGTLKVGDVKYNLNMRAGSNCFMIRSSDLAKIGLFSYHRVAGTKWTDKAVKMGYLAAVAPGKLAYDLGLRAGYNHKESLSIKKVLTNGDEIYFNTDEFKDKNPNLNYYE